jgi:hypothetical protein
VTATSTISLASSGGKVTGGAISAGSGVTLAALGDLTTAAITAGGALDAQGAGVNLGNVRALSIGTSATTTLTVGKVTATSGVVALTAVGDLASGTISASGAVSLTSSGGAVTGGAIGAGGDVALAAAGDLNAGTIAAGGTFDARGANLTLGDAKATRIAVLAGAALNIGAVDAGAGAIALTAGGAFKSGSLTATGAVDLASGAALSAGDVNAGQAVQAVAGGAATFGSVRSQTGTVELRSTGGALATGAVQAATDTALIAAGGLAVNAVAARDMVLLAGSGVSADSLTSSGGRILIGNAVMAAPGGSFGAFVYDAVFAAPLRQTGGTLAIGGKVSGAAVTAAIGGDAAMATVVASGTLLVDSGDTVQFGGLWQAPQIEIRANDIAIPAGAGLDAGRAGTILLVSRNTAGMRIGDGLDGSIVPASGYSLDNAEWSRIRSGSLTVFGLDGPGAVDMLIGTLDVTGPAAGSTIDDPAGKVVFRTGSAPAAAPSGTVRVVGALTARGFGSGNALAFANGQFELASDTGSVAALGAANALSGAVQIDADDIHIAAAPLLARLAADPFFAGAEAALDTQSAGGNQPVLRAGALDLTVGRTLYIQRSGAGANPFGFDAPLAGFTVKPAGARPITVIVNGTFQIAGKAIGGIEAWQTFTQSGVSISGFSPASRLNGCLLIAALCVAPPPDGIQDLIDPVDDPKTNDGAPGNPDKPGPPDEHAIQPPEIVLPVQPDAPPVHIDEPIAGSGNPALTGAAIGQGAGALK